MIRALVAAVLFFRGRCQRRHQHRPALRQSRRVRPVRDFPHQRNHDRSTARWPIAIGFRWNTAILTRHISLSTRSPTTKRAASRLILYQSALQVISGYAGATWDKFMHAVTFGVYSVGMPQATAKAIAKVVTDMFAFTKPSPYQDQDFADIMADIAARAALPRAS